jgi:hypothetical protein
MELRQGAGEELQASETRTDGKAAMREQLKKG